MNLDVKCFLMLVYTAVLVCSVAIRLSEMCVCVCERERERERADAAGTA